VGVKFTDTVSVKLVEFWGSDERIIESARMSTSGAFRGWPEDEKLLRYLWKNKHYSPFEMCGATLEIECPIYCARQIYTHRTFSRNERSARYTVVPSVFYVPPAFHAQGTSNKQCSGELLEDQGEPRAAYVASCEMSYETYCALLKAGVSREEARGVLPLTTMTKFRMSGNLRNWLHFLSLRTKKNAQLEVRLTADTACDIFKELFPRTMKLWKEDNV
jgi:thymidylate synthase (FAD)